MGWVWAVIESLRMLYQSLYLMTPPMVQSRCHRFFGLRGVIEAVANVVQTQQPMAITILVLTFCVVSQTSVFMNNLRGTISFVNCAWENNRGMGIVVINVLFNSMAHMRIENGC